MASKPMQMDVFKASPTQLKVKRLARSAELPTYATAGAACFDLKALRGMVVPVNSSRMVETGLAFEVPKDHVMLLFSRSGHGATKSVSLSNCVGVIDSDYRGEVKASLRNDGSEAFRIYDGDRIAQAMVIHASQVELIEVEELGETDRGAGGFGSTGV